MIKTFYAPLVGVTAPTGHVYCSQAHGAALFPILAQSTGKVPVRPGWPNPIPIAGQ